MARRTKETEHGDAARRHERLRYEIAGVLLVALGLFSLVSLAGLEAGLLGEWVHYAYAYLFGRGAFLPALLLILVGARYIYRHERLALGTREVVWFVYGVLLLVTIHWWYVSAGDELRPDYFVEYGGLIGGIGLLCLRTLFGEDGVKIPLVVIALVNTIILTQWTLADGMRFVKKKTQPALEKAGHRMRTEMEKHAAPAPVHEAGERKPHFFAIGKSSSRNAEADATEAANLTAPTPTEEDTPPTVPAVRRPRRSTPAADSTRTEDSDDTRQVKPEQGGGAPRARTDYRLPPLSLLQEGRSRAADRHREVEDNARKIEALMESFGVDAHIVHASHGPTVTRYELEPGPGVKVSRIVNLADDIALQLAATDVRIEAPIPGKAAVGIEVPNRTVDAVSLRDVLSHDEFRNARGGVVVGLGEDITGQPVITDLTKMPHLLVAGSTGSGKSVCINTLIAGVLFRSYPDEVKLILIDPKVVELAGYNRLPHLLTPVVTDPKKAAGVLRWAVREMENRYRLFASAKVKDIGRYNEAHPEEKLPIIVIIIDELADLMTVAPADVEETICRLAQMARAAGLHLVLATQRPSVDVITGTIKANIPSRISFAVSSQIDSRTILDMAGAEKLLGKGDMLFYPIGAAKPRRVQGAFVSDTEIEAVVEYIADQATPVYSETVTEAVAAPTAETPQWDDELLPEAVRMVMETEQASVSMLQRRFRIGYTRAGRLIDTMENMGIVGPNVGSKAREILLTPEEAEQLLTPPEEEVRE